MQCRAWLRRTRSRWYAVAMRWSRGSDLTILKHRSAQDPAFEARNGEGNTRVLGGEDGVEARYVHGGSMARWLDGSVARWLGR